MQNKSSNNLFNGQSFYIGIDCHKKNWTVTVLGEQYEHKTMSQNPDPNVLFKYMSKSFPGGTYKAVYEAGFSGFGACRRLKDLGIDCMVIHPADVPTNQKEKLQKTDPVDSRKLAKMLRSHNFEGINIPDPKQEADRSLMRQRFRLVKDLSRTKHRVKSLLMQFGIDIPDNLTLSQTRHWSKVYINWLKELPIEYTSLRQTLDSYISTGLSQRKELLSVNRQLRDLSKSDYYKQDTEILLSIPGIGLITAMTFLTEIGDVNRFKSLDCLCSFVGLVPTMHNSGDKVVNGKMIKRGRKELKIMLIEAAWDAIRIDPAMMANFNELTKRMNKNKAIIRIARKLLNRVRYLLMNKEKYELGVLN